VGAKKRDGIQSPPLGGFRGLTLQGLGGKKEGDSGIEKSEILK